MKKIKITIIALFTILLASALIPTLSFNINVKPLPLTKSKTQSPTVLSEGSNPGTSVIVFDQSHGQYYNSSLLGDFIAMLREDGNEVIINNASITKGLLDAADILILTNPDIYRPFTTKEIDAIKDLISKNGSLLVMGTWYRYFERVYLNLITGPYGIWWNDTQVIDKTDKDIYEYYPLIHNWTVNATPFIVGGVTYVQAARSTSLAVSGEAVPIGVGDDDTYAEDDTGAHVINGSNVIAFAAVDLPDGGRIFASGSSQMLQNEIAWPRFNNTLFAKNIIGWLEGEVRIKPPTTTITKLSVEYPPELDVLPLRDNATIKANITNYGNSEATDINATIYWPIVVTNQSKKTVDIPNLASGQSYVAEWKLEGILVGSGTVTVEVKSGNAETMSAAVGISVVSDIRILRFEAVPSAVFTPISNESMVNATIKNIASLVTHDVKLTLVLPPSGVTSAQPLTVNLGDLDPYNVTIVTWDITVEELGFYDLTLEVSTSDGGNPTAKTLLLAIIEELLVYDNGHGAYVDARKAGSFIELMREYGPVYISNSTITPLILSVTRLLVIPSPMPPTHTAEEIQAIKDYIESGGALFIMGTYYAFFDPSWYDSITSDYGIEWVKGSMRDANDHDPVTGYEYFVLLDTFPDNELANKLKVGVENIKMSGTTLKITDPAVYSIVTGDDDPPPNNTVTRDNGNILHEFNGTKTIPLAAVELTGGGKIVASGSDYFIRSDNPQYSFFTHNEQFLRNLVEYLLMPRPLTRIFKVTWGGISYWVAIFSNSTLGNFNFSQPLKQISFNVTGEPGTSGFCNVTIPRALLRANVTHPWQILLNGADITNDTIITENATHTFIYFTYSHSAQTVKIIGTEVIPEFPTWALALLMLFVLAVGVPILRKRMQSPVKYSNCQLRGG